MIIANANNAPYVINNSPLSLKHFPACTAASSLMCAVLSPSVGTYTPKGILKTLCQQDNIHTQVEHIFYKWQCFKQKYHK